MGWPQIIIIFEDANTLESEPLRIIVTIITPGGVNVSQKYSFSR
jgi:hypothetical protein